MQDICYIVYRSETYGVVILNAHRNKETAEKFLEQQQKKYPNQYFNIIQKDLI